MGKVYAIKCRKKDGPGKVWKFLAGDGYVNRLRIHAIQFTDKERADAICTRAGIDNSEYEFKVVLLD